MLSPGQVRWAYVAFEDRPGGKTRPVLILRVLRETAIILDGRSRYKEHLTLLLALDGAHPDSTRIRLWNDTYFYAENLREIPCADIAGYLGTISKAEAERVIADVNGL